MKIESCIAFLLLCATSANALSIPSEVDSIIPRNAAPAPMDSGSADALIDSGSAEIDLFKRKGGGGKGGGSGSSGSSGSSSGGSKGGSSAPSSGTSTGGGRTLTGSGPRPAYGGGAYYGGGASVPYAAGVRSPLGVSPFLFGGALGLTTFALLASTRNYAYPVYVYPLTPVSYFNQSANNGQGANMTNVPVNCICEEYQTCGCDNNPNSTYVTSLLGNGSQSSLNNSLVAIEPNGTILLDGTLPNGTTAPGGTADANAGVRLTGNAMGGLALAVAVISATLMM